MIAAVVIGGGRTFVAGADIKEFVKMTRCKGGLALALLPLSAEDRKLFQAGGDGDSWHRVWRRSGAGHVWPLPRGGANCAGWPAGGEARPDSRSRRARSACRVWQASRKPLRCVQEEIRSRRRRRSMLGLWTG